MAKNDIFKIEVLNWEKHNGKAPKGKIAFTHFMISARIFDDTKIATLSGLNKLLFIAILCRCASERSATIEVTGSQLRAMIDQTFSGIRPRIAALERNQLVRLLNQSALIREDKRREDKIREEKLRKAHEIGKNAKPASPAAPLAPAQSTSESSKPDFLIKKYCERWKERHGSSPPITGKDAGIAKRIAKGMGEQKIEFYLDAFFIIPDAYLMKAKHPLELFEIRLKEIAAFAESGQFVTRKQAAQADDMASNMILLEQVRKGNL